MRKDTKNLNQELSINCNDWLIVVDWQFWKLFCWYIFLYLFYKFFRKLFNFYRNLSSNYLYILLSKLNTFLWHRSLYRQGLLFLYFLKDIEFSFRKFWMKATTFPPFSPFATEITFPIYSLVYFQKTSSSSVFLEVKSVYPEERRGKESFVANPVLSAIFIVYFVY